MALVLSVSSLLSSDPQGAMLHVELIAISTYCCTSAWNLTRSLNEMSYESWICSIFTPFSNSRLTAPSTTYWYIHLPSAPALYRLLYDLQNSGSIPVVVSAMIPIVPVGAIARTPLGTATPNCFAPMNAAESDSRLYVASHLCSSGTQTYLCPRIINHSCIPPRPNPMRLFFKPTSLILSVGTSEYTPPQRRNRVEYLTTSANSSLSSQRFIHTVPRLHLSESSSDTTSVQALRNDSLSRMKLNPMPGSAVVNA